MSRSEAGIKRTLILAAGIAAVTALCVAAVFLIAESRFEEASQQARTKVEARSTTRDKASEKNRAQGENSDKDPISPEARWYARDMDVSLEEADRRLDMQDDPLPINLERKLKKEEPDCYAGLWLRHMPDYGITVALVGDSEAAREKVRRFVEGTQWEGTVNIKHVEASLVELNAARAEAEKILNRLGVIYESDINVYKNRIELYVANKAQLERKLSASGLELPGHVFVGEGLSTPD